MPSAAKNRKFLLREMPSLRLLLAGIICGIAGVMLDLDHVPSRIFHMRLTPIYLIPGFYVDKLQMGWGRPFHNLILVLACLTVIGTVTLLFQYHIRRLVAMSVNASKKAVATIILKH